MPQSLPTLVTAMLMALLSMLLMACHSPVPNNDCTWELIYRNDKNGNTLHGQKDDLIQAVRNGQSIRVGWGVRRPSDTIKSVEHVADAQFLTIANGEEVFAQITAIIGQRPELNADTIGITFHEPLSWIIMVGSNGFTDRMMTNRFEDTIRSHRQVFGDVSWFVEYTTTSQEGSEKPDPLWAQ